MERILSDSTSESKLQYMPGVGPARASLLARMGLYDASSLLCHYPRDYEDRRFLYRIREAPAGRKSALKGVIQTVEFSRTRGGLGVACAVLGDESGTIEAVWFKRLTPRYDVFASLRQQLVPGRVLIVYGSVDWGPGGRQIRVDDKSIGDDPVHFGRIVPAYSVTEGLSERLIRSLVARAIAANEAKTRPVVLPEWITTAYGLADPVWALEKLHFPDTLVQKEQAREILAFEEFFLLETALAQTRRQAREGEKSHRYSLKRTLLTPFRESLGFEFTAAQKRVIREIFDDLMHSTPMNRLLQGDVGSGKTLVALSAMLLAVENGYQAALMAPTEILAEQHALTLQRFLNGLNVRVALLSGRLTAAQRRTIYAQVAAGNVDLVIGTHALIQEDVGFQNLKLVVVDEQHRFGVEHRRLLRQKGHQTDLLVMTATPIPRTLALTLYGDLDVSTLDQLPPGRTPVTTRLEPEDNAYRILQDALRQGRQGYLIFPLVNESDKMELKAAVREAEALRAGPFQHVRVGLLHGQMKAAEKETVMRQFRSHEIDLLIATSIIEVGIDVPNATAIAIQHAERFGLATLHQLRGRVGRGPLPSQCLLIADTRTPEAQRRMDIMVQITDGFALSEADLEMRGPGEVLGDMQHGIPLFRAGDLRRDAPVIQRARQAAEELLRRDPSLAAPEHRELRDALRETYGSRWAFGTTG